MREIRQIKPAFGKIPKRKRVAAYARVSSGKDAMLHSLSAQVSFYSEYIQRRLDWSFAGVYADEALTGTSEQRPEFQRMLDDCRNGKIDIVVTKSVTRFARNTLTLLETVRELKELGIDVFFQKENIHSLSGDGELMLSILASFAQEESRSVSENCKWRIREMFEKGLTNCGLILGYKLVDGIYQIVPDEAETVKMIFNDYLSGMGRNAIVKKLNGMGVVTKRGGRWCENGVVRVLRNEKYIGELNLQKVYVPDHISKKRRINRGELPMYHVADSHEAIIDKSTFERVQMEFERRAQHFNIAKTPANSYPLTSKISCELCGRNYKRKIASAGSKYAKPVWICSTFNSQGKAACPSKQIPESILMETAAGILGMDEFDAEVFETQIKRILVPEAGKLVFVFRDGKRAEALWENRSRRDSWDEAAKTRQSELMKARSSL